MERGPPPPEEVTAHRSQLSGWIEYLLLWI